MATKEQTIADGFAAMDSMNKISHAVSTPKRFEKFAGEKNLETISEEETIQNLNECIKHNGRVFELVSLRKQKGYGAWHIGSEIDEVVQSGRQPLIVNLPRNRRKLFASVD